MLRVCFKVFSSLDMFWSIMEIMEPLEARSEENPKCWSQSWYLEVVSIDTPCVSIDTRVV